MKPKLSSHPNLVQVVHNQSNGTVANNGDFDSDSDEKFDSKLISKCSFKKGDLITLIENYVVLEQPDYLSVQIGSSKHASLNSDFNYLDHSCNPNVRIDVKQMAFIAEEDISPGDNLSFFYPSTEWDMNHSFECWCGSKGCLREISGAKYVEPYLMNKLKERYFFNEFILELFVKKIVY